MYRQIVATSSIFSLLFSSPLLAAQCQNPFENTSAQFQLFEQLDCKAKTSPVVLQIVPMNSTASASSPYLSPKCDKESPLFELFDGAFVIDYSESLANAHDSKVHVLRTCDGSRLFMIDRESGLLTLPSGQQVNTSIRIYAEDSGQTLLMYARVDEDNDNGLVLRKPDTSSAVIATKAFKQIGDSCSATWTVSNAVSDELTATIAAFAIMLKDNTEFSCVPLPPACPPSSLSTGAAIGIGMAIGASIASAVGVTVVCYMRHRPSYQKLLE